MDVTEVDVKSILTRTTGFLKTVTSHSVQPYRGCSFGNSMCGVGCYVQHSYWVTKGRKWGSFLEVRKNAASAYLGSVCAERRWAQKACGSFGVFMSSATDPFVPQEKKYGITSSLLRAMTESPPDRLILQTHSHLAVDYVEDILEVNAQTDVSVHFSIETDRESFPGLPRHASSVEDRFLAAGSLKQAGLRVVITVSPLMPIDNPHAFFERIASCADAIVIDHFVEGDGSKDGQRTMRTVLPDAIRSVDERALGLDYREEMVAVAERYLPGCVGTNVDGFAGRYRGGAGAGESGGPENDTLRIRRVRG